MLFRSNLSPDLLNPAERVFEEVRREIEGKVYANLDEKVTAAQEFLTDLELDLFLRQAQDRRILKLH